MQRRRTEGCSKHKMSVDMTSSGLNGLNIRTFASPKWDRTRCPEELASSVYWLYPMQTFYGNLRELGNNVKNGDKVQFGNKVTVY